MRRILLFRPAEVLRDLEKQKTMNTSNIHVCAVPATATVPVKIQHNGSALQAIYDKAEAHRYGLTPVLLVTVACFGSFAAAFASEFSALRLLPVVISTGLVESF